jgi:hypothetical protein
MNLKPFVTGIKGLLYHGKDFEFKWPPLLCMFLAITVVDIQFSEHCAVH